MFTVELSAYDRRGSENSVTPEIRRIRLMVGIYLGDLG